MQSPVLSFGPHGRRAGIFVCLLSAAYGVAAVAQAAGAGKAEHVMVLPSDVKWAPAPKSIPAGAQAAVIEGNPAEAGPFTMRLRLPAGYKIPAHSHPGVEHVTVLSGTFHLGMGDKLDEKAGKKFPVGSFVVMPVGVNHFAWASEDTVIQLHGVGPWGLTYVNPADDPRKSN